MRKAEPRVDNQDTFGVWKTLLSIELSVRDKRGSYLEYLYVNRLNFSHVPIPHTRAAVVRLKFVLFENELIIHILQVRKVEIWFGHQ